MKLRILNALSGAPMNQAEVAIGGYAVAGHILVEFTSPEHLHPVCALTLTPEEAGEFAASLNDMALLRLHRAAPDRGPS